MTVIAQIFPTMFPSPNVARVVQIMRFGLPMGHIPRIHCVLSPTKYPTTVTSTAHASIILSEEHFIRIKAVQFAPNLISSVRFWVDYR